MTNVSVSHVPVFVVFQRPADLGLEESERAVVGGQTLDVGVDLVLVDEALEDHHRGRLRLDLRLQPPAGDELVADELHRPDLLSTSPR